jgi:hypothetical protein
VAISLWCQVGVRAEADMVAVLMAEGVRQQRGTTVQQSRMTYLPLREVLFFLLRMVSYGVHRMA